MRHRRTTVAVIALSAMLCACSADEAGPPPPVTAAGATVDEVIALATPPTTPVVLASIPDGASVRRVSPTWIESFSADYDPLGSGATLYGDWRSANPLDGPLLLVGSSSGSASIGGPRQDVPGAHPVAMPGLDGAWTFVPAGDHSWLVRSGLGEDSVSYVVGQDVSEEELMTAARGADFLGAPPTVQPDSLPAGLAPLVAGLPGDGPRPWQAAQIEVIVQDVRVEVSAVRADQRLAWLWGFWATGEGAPADDGLSDALGADATLLRAGPMPATIVGDEVYGVVWAEGDNVVSVVGVEWSLAARTAAEIAPIVEAVAAEVRPGTAEEVSALAEHVLGPPTAADFYCPADAPVISGRTGDVRWSYAAGPDPEWESPLHECAGLTNPVDGMTTNDNIRHADLALTPVGSLIPSSPYGNQPLDRPQHAGTLLTGIAPPGTARVVVTAPAGEQQDALLGGSGPRPGEQLFAAYFAGQRFVAMMQNGPYTVAAFDAAGALIDDAVIL